MQASTKSLLMLVTMLLLGAVLGAAGMTWLRPQPPVPPPGGGPGGFVSHMEGTIEPRDAAQRAAILPHLEATDRSNRAVVEGSRRAMRDNLDSMMTALTPLLDDAQLARLHDLVRRLDRAPPGGRPPRDGGPPPGGGPPRPGP